MLWEPFMENLATLMGVSTSIASLTVSVLLTFSLMLAVLIALQGKSAEIPSTITAMICIILFTGVGWLSIWIGVILALGIAAAIGLLLSKTARSGEG